jgi:hypothetical protein
MRDLTEEKNASYKKTNNVASKLIPELERLDGISQGVRCFTAAGAGASYSRLSHSVDVLNVVHELTSGVDLKPQYKMTLELLALFHDIGHLPFSHSGEDALRRLSEPFDHDEFGAGLVLNSRSGAHQVCLENGICPELMAELIRTNSERTHPEAFLVKEIADRVAYLRSDLKAGCVPPWALSKLEDTVRMAKESIAWSWDGYTLKDTSFLAEILRLRDIKVSVLDQNAYNLIAHEVVAQGIGGLINNRKISVDDFLVATDADVMWLFDPQLRELLLNGIENSFTIIEEVRVSAASLTTRGDHLGGRKDTKQLLEIKEGILTFVSYPSLKEIYVPQTIADSSPIRLSAAESRCQLIKGSAVITKRVSER